MAATKNPFDSLESNDAAQVEEFKINIKEQFNRTKDPWIMNGVYDYFMRTHSQRAVDVIAMVNEPHDKHFLDRIVDGLRGTNKLAHLTLLGYLVRRRPTWLYKIFRHNLWIHLIQILKTDTDIVIIVSALLILNILIPLVPRLIGPVLPEIFAVFSKLAALNANVNNYQDVQLVHLQISLYTLFHRLYGMFPNNFINFLRKEYLTHDTYPVFSHTVKPMLDTVRVNHLLISANEAWEIEPTRWNNVESHDIIVSCANLLMSGESSNREYHQQSTSIYEPKPTFNCNELLGAVKVTGKQSVAEYCKQLGKGVDDPTSLSPSVRFLEKRPAESIPAAIPLTPITRGYEVSSPYSEHEGSSPPEAAVEATPESTPIRENLTTAPPSLLMTAPVRPMSLLKESIQQGTAVPMSDRSFPSSPIKKESSPIRYSAPEIILYGSHQPSARKFNMLLADRTQAASSNNAVEMKPIVSGGVGNTNDLISENRKQPVISSVNTFTFVDEIRDGKENGTGCSDKCDAGLEPVDDFDACEMEGSPCSSGGLHMFDSKSLSHFALRMKKIRSRHYSQCNSDSERFSPSNSPQDKINYFKNSKVRRTNSCPEMKKSSPNSTTLSSDSPVLEERDENDEIYDSEKAVSTRRKTKKLTTLKVTIETQTDDIPLQPHFPYEHLFLDVFPPLHPSQQEDKASPAESTNSLEERLPASVYKKANSPSKLLQKYIEAAGQCYDDKVAIRENFKSPSIVLENKYLLDQLRLMGVQLQMEEHKREVHAERNRRLLPRSRRNKTLEEHNNALISQVTLLQKELQHTNEEVAKIVQEKEAQISLEQQTASHWRNLYGTLQQDYKAVTSRCQHVEVLLKEEKDSNDQNLKQLNETKAILGDITNDLHSCQKDAMEVKDLRRAVGELQFEIIKAGELITLYRNRLKACLPTDDKAQLDDMVVASVDERQKLKKIISEQKASLEATQTLMNVLRKNIESKENQIEKLNSTLTSAQNTLEKSVQDWKKKYEEIRTLYDQEKCRANDFEMQNNRFKLLMKSTNAKMAPQKEMCMRRGNLPLVDDGAGSAASISKSAQGVPKSPKSFLHSAQLQQQTKTVIEHTVTASELSQPASSPTSEQPKEWDSQLRAKMEKRQSPTTSVSRESSVDGEGTSSGELSRPITKKKTRTECAESGQLRSISYTQLDPEPPTRKE